MDKHQRTLPPFSLIRAPPFPCAPFLRLKHYSLIVLPLLPVGGDSSLLVTDTSTADPAAEQAGPARSRAAVGGLAPLLSTKPGMTVYKPVLVSNVENWPAGRPKAGTAEYTWPYSVLPSHASDNCHPRAGFTTPAPGCNTVAVTVEPAATPARLAVQNAPEG